MSLANIDLVISFDKTSKELLENPKVAAMYLEEILEDGDMELFTAALKDVADARVGSMTSLSKKTQGKSRKFV